MGKGNARGKAIVLSVPFAANVGGLGTPIGSPPNAIAMQYMSEQGIAPSFAQWMMIGVPGVVAMLALAWVVLLFFFRGDGEPLPKLDHQVNIKIDRKFWTIVITVVVTAIGWMTSATHGLSSGTIALIPVLVFFGLGVLDKKDLRNMSWDVLLMMGGGLCLGSVIANSGLADWMVHQLPVDGVSTFWLTVLFGFVACFMSSVMSHTAAANLLMPIIIGVSVGSASPIMIGAAFSCSLAMPLPVSTPPNAMAFSSGQISVIDMAKPGIILTLLGVTLAMTTGYWWWQTVGIW
jgi:sodium-dependent dicarboxylate transporter 2/3/5